MSVAICRSSTAVPLPLEKAFLMPTPLAASKTWLLPSGADTGNEIVIKNEEQELKKTPPPGQLDIWTSIQAATKLQAKETKDVVEPAYVHPLMRRSSSLMSQRSLEVCTEPLGSETGSDDFFDDDALFSTRNSNKKQLVVQQEQEQEQEQGQEDHDDVSEADDEFAGMKWKEQAATVNYHCSISGRRTSSCRSFPPPLPSISRRDGRCFQMRPHRRDGRLVVEAVPVPSQNYLQAERQGGRLLLSFINTTTSTRPKNFSNSTVTEQTVPAEEKEEEEVMEEEEEEEVMELEDQEEEEEEEEEEEVEVVDRGTVVEVKVSTQPQQQTGGSSAMKKVHRSSIVINKFVSCTSSQLNEKENVDHRNATVDSATDTAAPSPAAAARRSSNYYTTTTAAAAAVAASSLSSTLPAADVGSQPSFDNKQLLFTSKRRNREELLRDMRRCSQLRKPLFIWEPTCIATSS